MNLKRINQIPAWGVTIYHYIPATYNDPPDSSEQSMGQANGVPAAVGLFLKTVLDMEFDNYMESLMWEMMPEIVIH